MQLLLYGSVQRYGTLKLPQLTYSDSDSVIKPILPFDETNLKHTENHIILSSGMCKMGGSIK